MSTSNKSSKWTLKDKRKLADLLIEYPLNAYQSIARRLKTKTEEQVRTYVVRIQQQIRTQSSRKGSTSTRPEKAPLDHWLCMTRDLVEKEYFDCSTHLSKIMSIISQFEPRSEVDSNSCTPNYKAIYTFLSQILQTDRKEDVDKLGPLESAVLLDLLYKVYEMLDMTDTSLQEKVMRWKYSLLDYRNTDGEPDFVKLRQAATNDVNPLIEEEMNTSVIVRDEKGPVKRGSRRKEPPSATDTQSYSSNQLELVSKQGDSEAVSSQGDNEAVRSQGDSEAVGSQGDSEAVGSQGDSEAVRSQGDSEAVSEAEPVSGHVEINPSRHLKSVVQAPPDRHKPGRKSLLAPPEQPITSIVYVMPPKDIKILNYEPRKKSAVKDRSDGKYQSVTDSQETIIHDCLQKKHKVFYNVKTSEMSEFIQKDTASETSDTSQRAGIEGAQDVQQSPGQAQKQKLDDPSSAPQHAAPLKKPKLYAINPLCVPVKILNLNLQD